MATSIDSKKREDPTVHAARMQEAAITAASPSALDLASDLPTQPAPGVNPDDFVRANRIHVKDGSLFIDPYLVLHPHELAPTKEAETKLRQKLQLTYSINNPSFFESSERTTIALNLGQIIPTSLGARRSKMLEDITTLNREIDTGHGSEPEQELAKKRAPFAAIVRDVMEHPAADPVGVDVLKNSLAVYLLLREKLTQNGYLKGLSEYVKHTSSPDQVLADLADNVGATPMQIREAALQGGVDGIGKLLGLDPKYISDVKELTRYAATQDFSYNLIEHWHLGRQLQGLKAPMEEKILTGIDARITAKISEYRDRIRHRFEVPEPVKAQEEQVAANLNLVEPIQREVMYRLGYEVCYSPDFTADDIAFFRSINGLHRKAANDLRDIRGTYRIYFAGRGDLESSQRTLVHEVAHNLWPEQFTAADTQQIDALATADQQRFTHFQQMMETHYAEFEKLFNAYKAGTPQQRLAITDVTNERFAAYGFQAEGLFPYLREANDFRTAVRHAFDTLSIEGARYNHSGYDTPQERFREVISRFAELKQVKYRGEPEFLNFLSPGLNQVWEQHYIPHLGRVNEMLKNGQVTPAHRDSATQKDTAPNPKVEERPTEPGPLSTTAHASLTNDAAPGSTIHTQGLTRDTAAAQLALKNMGIGSIG